MSENTSRLGGILKTLDQQRVISAADVADATGASLSTAYRWMQGESEPPYSQLRALCRELPAEAAEQIVRDLIGSRFTLIAAEDADPDINGDGRVDVNDALDGAITCTRDANHMLEQVRDATRDGQITQKEVTTIHMAGVELGRSARRLVSAAEHAAVKPKQAKPMRLAE